MIALPFPPAFCLAIKQREKEERKEKREKERGKEKEKENRNGHVEALFLQRFRKSTKKRPWSVYHPLLKSVTIFVRPAKISCHNSEHSKHSMSSEQLSFGWSSCTRLSSIVGPHRGRIAHTGGQ